MKIATWNIAGIKARLTTLTHWLEQYQPDIICLQEVKSVDEDFPRSTIQSLGYHIETHGQKSFNGVAILSKQSPDEILRRLPGDSDDIQARYIEAVYSTDTGVLRIASLYLPNGNPVDSDKYPYKLNWMKRLQNHAINLLKYEEPLVLAGDYNVISSIKDAKNPQQWVGDALYLPKTRESFHETVNLGFYDAVNCVSDNANYTFWDFQAGAWPKDNGINIDHLLLSPEVADLLLSANVQREVRGWEKPSDHVPVFIELNTRFSKNSR